MIFISCKLLGVQNDAILSSFFCICKKSLKVWTVNSDKFHSVLNLTLLKTSSMSHHQHSLTSCRNSSHVSVNFPSFFHPPLSVCLFHRVWESLWSFFGHSLSKFSFNQLIFFPYLLVLCPSQSLAELDFGSSFLCKKAWLGLPYTLAILKKKEMLKK